MSHTVCSSIVRVQTDRDLASFVESLMAMGAEDWQNHTIEPNPAHPVAVNTLPFVVRGVPLKTDNLVLVAAHSKKSIEDAVIFTVQKISGEWYVGTLTLHLEGLDATRPYSLKEILSIAVQLVDD